MHTRLLTSLHKSDVINFIQQSSGGKFRQSFETFCSPDGVILRLLVADEVNNRFQGMCSFLDGISTSRGKLLCQSLHLQGRGNERMAVSLAGHSSANTSVWPKKTRPPPNFMQLTREQKKSNAALRSILKIIRDSRCHQVRFPELLLYYLYVR